MKSTLIINRYILIMFVCMGTYVTHAQVPPLLEYNGLLTGNITGNRTMGVNLYNASTSGTILYSETIGTVNVTNGQFFFQYGQSGTTGNGTPIAIADALTGDQDWLALTINGTEQFPRERLLSVPFALRSADARALRQELISLGVIRIPFTALVSTLAGGAAGFADGNGVNAKLYLPSGVAADGNGNLYVADTNNQRIRKITPAGVVSTIAGAGTMGITDGNGVNAKFANPSGVAADGNGNLYITDSYSNRIRKITPAGVVSTLAGSTAGFADGNGVNAKFAKPSGVAVDGGGNLYIADTNNQRIRKITPAGVVSTLAGSTGGFADGNGVNAKFSNPSGIAVDGNGNVYVADTANNKIRKISSAGVVTTLAGGSFGFADGTRANAMFFYPSGVALGGNGDLYITDYSNQRIRKVTSTGLVTTIAGYGSSGSLDGSGLQAQFFCPIGVAVDGNGNVYVADSKNNKIRKITISQ